MIFFFLKREKGTEQRRIKKLTGHTKKKLTGQWSVPPTASLSKERVEDCGEG